MTPFSLPINPLERLQVNDGLLLTAERWRLAHDYHRQRQNVHYQALNQAGVVWGLGVSVVAAPNQVAAQYRDGRWVQIQPGIAIDPVGNPIIVPEAINFRIASDPPAPEALTIYLVISYVDPDRLQRQTHDDLVQETFRIDEKNSAPVGLEVELCRLVLQPGSTSLENPTNVFFPGLNALDLRFRQQAEARSQGVVRVAQVLQDTPEDEAMQTRLAYLLQATRALYPAVQGATAIGQMTLESGTFAAIAQDYDLIYLPYSQLSAFKDQDLEALKHYLNGGGVVWFQVSSQETNISELYTVQQELQQAIARLRHEADFSTVRQDLEAELASVNDCLTQQLEDLCQPVKATCQQINIAATASGLLDRQHPLRNQPFLFAKLPTVNDQPIQMLNWDGIVLVIGDLSVAWGLDETLALSRDAIRTAQELGINLLHFAWRRRQLAQWMVLHPAATLSPEDAPKASRPPFSHP